MEDVFQAKAPPLSQAGFDAALRTLDLANGEAVLWAVLSVESRGFGYLTDRRPKILFERHVFHGLTEGRFSARQPDISNRSLGGYVGNEGEYARLKRAMLLDRGAALKSASWGLGQVMGFNAVIAGYSSVEDMVEAFVESEDAQLIATAKFIEKTKIKNTSETLAYQLRQKNWARFARYYNGPDYAAKHYDKKLEVWYDAFIKSGKLPDLRIRHAQALLARLGFNPKGIDGVEGTGTTAALEAFRKRYGMEADASLETTITGLDKAAGIA